MKVYQIRTPGEGEYVEIETPVPVGDEVLVKVAYCGICGTDYALSSGNSSFVRNGQVTYPLRLGHEWSGYVAAVGPDVTHVKVGDPVVSDNNFTCNECEHCQRGDYGACVTRRNVGTINPYWPGAFAQYFLAPARHIYKLADNISVKDAALCEPLSVAYGGINKMTITPDSIVVVIGTGCIGLAAAALALYEGAGQVYLVGLNAFKLERAKQVGVTDVIDTSKDDPVEKLLALTGGRYADYILECSGNPVTVTQALNMVAPRGTITLIGFYEQDLSGFPVDTLVSKEVKLIGIMGEFGNMKAVVDRMATGKLKLDGIITEMVTFDRCNEAMFPNDKRHIIKTMVKMEE